MPTLLRILPPKVQKGFDKPPQFTLEGRREYFKLDDDLRLYVDSLKSDNNKVGFVLQLGYFRFAGKFFTSDLSYKGDIDFISKDLGVNKNAIDLSTYKNRTIHNHKEKILELLDYKPFSATEKNLLKEEIIRLTHKQIRPQEIMQICVNNLRDRKVELPTYHVFADLITTVFNQFENDLVTIIGNNLTQEQHNILDELLPVDSDGQKESYYKRAKITALKHINHTIKPGKIKQGIQNLLTIEAIRNDFQPIIDALNLSPESRKYYAVWVIKARSLQVKQFPKPAKRYLHLLAFIDYQYHVLQDALVDILLQSVQTIINKVNREQQLREFNQRPQKNAAIMALSTSHKTSQLLLNCIDEIVHSPVLTDEGKIECVKQLLENTAYEPDKADEDKIEHLEKSIQKAINNVDHLDILESFSVKLQNRVSDCVATIKIPDQRPSKSHLNITFQQRK